MRRLVSTATAATAASLKRLRPFELERNALWWTPGIEQLTASDVEPLTLAELLEFEPGSQQSLQSISLGYPDSQGSPGLRQAIADMHGDNVGADSVTIVHPAEGILREQLLQMHPTNVSWPYHPLRMSRHNQSAFLLQ